MVTSRLVHGRPGSRLKFFSFALCVCVPIAIPATFLVVIRCCGVDRTVFVLISSCQWVSVTAGVAAIVYHSERAQCSCTRGTCQIDRQRAASHRSRRGDGRRAAEVGREQS